MSFYPSYHKTETLFRGRDQKSRIQMHQTLARVELEQLVEIYQLEIISEEMSSEIYMDGFQGLKVTFKDNNNKIWTIYWNGSNRHWGWRYQDEWGGWCIWGPKLINS